MLYWTNWICYIMPLGLFSWIFMFCWSLPLESFFSIRWTANLIIDWLASHFRSRLSSIDWWLPPHLFSRLLNVESQFVCIDGFLWMYFFGQWLIYKTKIHFMGKKWGIHNKGSEKIERKPSSNHLPKSLKLIVGIALCGILLWIGNSD